jgi:hypothetical protein
MKRDFIFVLALTLSMLTACDKYCDRYKESIFEMTVASTTIKGMDPESNLERECLLVKYDGHTNWEAFGASILGFDYVKGYEYRLLLKMIPIKNPIGYYRASYTLIEIISMIEKESEIPPR